MFTHLLSVLLTVGTLFTNPAYTPLSDLPSTDDVHKLETAISGNTLHATWYEGYSSSTRRYYRRSTDLGVTWETPIEMEEDNYYMSGCTNNFCVTPEGYVHILSNDHSGHLIRHFSSDNGATFIVDTLYDGGQYGSYQTVIKAKDNKVAIACNYKPIAAAPWQLHILYSDDYGVTFSDTLASAPDLTYFMDMELTDTRITMAYRYEYWYSTLIDGRIYVSTADITEDGLTNLQHHLVNPQLSNGTYKCMYTSESDVYTPCLIDDNGTLHMTFYGQVTDSIAHSEDWHTIYTQSTDGGQTWRTPVVLRGNNKHPYPAMIAKNGHIYILARDRKFFYSHDNGATWSETDILNMDGGVGLSGSYHLWFDPTDTDGLSVNVAGNYWTWMHTSDGFLHVDAGNTITHMSDFAVGYVTFEVDAQGHRHYFLVASPRFTGHTSLLYIGEGNQPAPGEEQAWDINLIEGQMSNRAYVPASPSLNRCDSAFTVELWVKIDSLMGSNALITRTTSQYYGYSIWNPGWGIKIDGDRLVACLSTDKSDDFRATELGYGYEVKCALITAHTWHHVAITYDATSDQLDNFFFYVDGLLVGKASLTGVAPTDYYPIILGSDPDWRTNHIEMDNIRIWDRALSLDELRSHQPVVNGAANGLVLNLKMDGTLQDASGYHNDGMLIYSPSYAASNIDMPQADMIYSLNNKTVTCVDNTANGSAYFWDMGDYEAYYYYNYQSGNSAQHEYNHPGSYEIGMKAANESAAWSATRVIEFEGLSRIEPYRTGNLGWYQATIYGCDLTNDPSQIYLSNNGHRIPVDTIYSSEPGKLRVRFTMNNAPTGNYDLTVGEYTLPQGMLVIPSEERFRPEMTMQGRDKLLYGKWQTYTFTISHHNNVMMTNIPIYLFFENTPSLEVEFVNFEVVMPDVSEEAKQEIRDSIGDYFVREIKGRVAGLSADSGRMYRYYPLLVPVVYPGEAYELKVRIRSNEDVDMIYGISDSWDWSTDAPRQSWEEYERSQLMAATPYHAPARLPQAPQGVGLAAGECMMTYIGRGVVAATAGAVPGLDCIVGGGFAIYDLQDDIRTGADRKKRISNWSWNMGGTIAGCATSFLGPIAGFVCNGVIAMITNYSAVKDCIDQVDHNRNNVRAVGSLDPNEMIGPAGIGEDHWLLPGAAMPYTILFENKSTATAPAHVITISDTINVEHYDMSSFRFNNFGWGDTIISASQADPCQFVQDIDLRPAKPIIVRVAGAVDTISGIINWSITSLNPGTMEEEEDPDLGVLPPNDSIGSGEGFVSFFLQLKDSLPNDTRVTNRATIIFDVNAPIMTNTYVNGIDDESPLSQIAGAEEQGDSLLISLSGYDRHSGIDYYTLWAQTAGHDYEKVTTTNGEAVRVAKPTEETCFFVRATDMMGWTEPKDYSCEYRFVPQTDAVEHLNASHSDVEKQIINGQLVIKVNGHSYNAQGTPLK